MKFLFRNISNKLLFPGINIYETKFLRKNSAITLPPIGIFIHSNIKGQERELALQHEYGHYLDYLSIFKNSSFAIAVIKFYLKTGLPSLFSAIKNKVRHRSFKTEIRANKLAVKWFGKNLAPGFKNTYPIK